MKIESKKLTNYLKGGLGALALTSCLSSSAFAQSSEQRMLNLEQEVQFLSEQLIDLQVENSSEVPINTFDSIKFNLGGFITQTYTVNHAGDFSTDDQFDQTNIELLLSADITEEDRFFASLGYLRQHDFDNEHTLQDVTLRGFGRSINRNPLIIGWWEHTFGNSLAVKAGRFITPWGIINTEHFPPTLQELNQPIFLRPFEGNLTIPNFLNGVEASGGFAEQTISYNAYYGQFSGEPGESVFGGRLTWDIPGDIAVLGGSYQNGVKTGSGEDETYNAFGVDLLLNYNHFGMKAEWYNSSLDIREDEEAFYVQPFVTLGDFILFYRYDSIDLDDTVVPGRDEVEHIVGLNYFFDEKVRLRAQYTFNEYDVDQDSLGQDRDFNQLQFSVTASF